MEFACHALVGCAAETRFHLYEKEAAKLTFLTPPGLLIIAVVTFWRLRSALISLQLVIFLSLISNRIF